MSLFDWIVFTTTLQTSLHSPKLNLWFIVLYLVIHMRLYFHYSILPTLQRMTQISESQKRYGINFNINISSKLLATAILDAVLGKISASVSVEKLLRVDVLTFCSKGCLLKYVIFTGNQVWYGLFWIDYTYITTKGHKNCGNMWTTNAYLRTGPLRIFSTNWNIWFHHGFPIPPHLSSRCGDIDIWKCMSSVKNFQPQTAAAVYWHLHSWS